MYTIGGSVTGLRGTGLVLENNGSDPLVVTADGSLTFSTPLASGASYAVTVRTQPAASPAEICVVARGNGAVAGAPVTDLTVTCSVAAGKFLYVANALNQVAGFSIDPTTGALTEIPGSPFGINGYPPTDLYVDKAGTHLFINGVRDAGSAAGPSSFTGYAIDQASGALTLIPAMPIINPSSLYFGPAFFHPNGLVLYLPRYLRIQSFQFSHPENGIYGYSIDQTTGVLTPIPGSPYRFQSDSPPRIGVFNRAGTTVFATSSTTTDPSARVNAFAADATTGALTLQGSADFPSPVNSIIVHPDEKFAYTRLTVGGIGLLQIENPAAISAALTPMTIPGIGTTSAFDASGHRAYFLVHGTLSPTAGSVFGFNVDTASGALTPLAGSPYPTNGSRTEWLVMDPTKRYLVATNYGSGTVASFAINSVTGELKHVPGSPITPTVGSASLGVTFHPSGRFAYVPDGTAHSVSAYSIDPVNGSFVFVGSYPVGARPVAFARIAGFH